MKLNIKINIALAGLFLLRTGSAYTQEVPTPAVPQAHAIVLRNATIHTGNGNVIERGTIVFESGKILSVGVNANPPAGAKEIDLTGKHIYPGLIAPNTVLGLTEIEAVRSTRDVREPGPMNPNARALIAYNTDSRVTPTVRSNGILIAQIVPDGELFAGTSSVVQLDAWNWEDAAYLADDGVHLHWPSMSFHQFPNSPPLDEQKKNLEQRLILIEQAMQDAKNYWRVQKAGAVKSTDLRWEAMIPVLEKKKPLYIHASTEKEIAAAVGFSIQHDLKMILVGGEDSWRTTQLLKANNIPVILNETHALPLRDDDPIDIAARTPKILKDAGIQFCLTKEGFWDVRNLPFVAGTSVAGGLSKEEALRAITLSTAEILGIADKCGSLETGKDANIVVSSGDLLDMRSAKVEQAFIQGREIDLGNKQKDLYKKFRNR